MVETARQAMLDLWSLQQKTSVKLGWSFWAPLLWLLFVFVCAVTATLWALPPVDLVDWQNQASLPGTKSLVPLISESSGTEGYFTHLLGTDSVGRDILSRLIFGTQTSLTIGIISSVLGMIIGGSLGMLAGFYRGKTETLIVGTMDTMLAFPNLVLLLVMTYLIGSSLMNITLILGWLTIPAFCRVARANTLKLSELEFIQAARASGARDRTILLREILPNVLIPLAIYALLVVARLIIIEGGLGFLGLSVPAPTPSWGGMIAEGYGVLKEAPHVSLIPMLAMFLTILSFNLLGDRLRSLTDIRESRL
jgi:peptide/nickel transport system permease protein